MDYRQYRIVIPKGRKTSKRNPTITWIDCLEALFRPWGTEVKNQQSTIVSVDMKTNQRLGRLRQLEFMAQKVRE